MHRKIAAGAISALVLTTSAPAHHPSGAGSGGGAGPIVTIPGTTLEQGQSAAAIVFDAFIVRMALIPALLFLLGEKAWWLPAWLDRLLPEVDVEGEKLQRPAPVAHPLSEGDLDELADDVLV